MDKGKEIKAGNELCQNCKKNPAIEDHPCPYNEDINNDSETLCNCCLDCSDECAMGI